MSNKLQELTDRLYNEGLSKGKEEGELLLAKAQKEAEELISSAKAQAADIIAKAQQKAEELSSKAESDIKLAANQSLQATKLTIENVLVDASISDKVSKACSEVDFIKSIISEVAAKFSSENSQELSLVLPESLKAQTEDWLKNELRKQLGSEVKANFSKQIRGGFTIGPKDGSYYVSLSEETFKELIAEYLRPITKKILFG